MECDVIAEAWLGCAGQNSCATMVALVITDSEGQRLAAHRARYVAHNGIR
jgi:hypothetical protein